MNTEDIKNLKSLVPVLKNIVSRAESQIMTNEYGNLVGFCGGYEVYKHSLKTLIETIKELK